jgi:hypothetical protein
LHAFVEPFCFHKENKKAIIIYFTTMRLVNELFALLSGLSKDVVAGYFKRTFSGSWKGHTAAVIVGERLCTYLQEKIWKISHRV